MTTDHIPHMIQLAHNVLPHAYAPFSKFHVAACIRSKNNTFFTGVNVENASYGLTVCAECSAISNMVTSGETRIEEMVVMASSNMRCPPCGACRQRIAEFSTPTTKIHLCDQTHVLETYPLDALLPHAFTFSL